MAFNQAELSVMPQFAAPNPGILANIAQAPMGGALQAVQLAHQLGLTREQLQTAAARVNATNATNEATTRLAPAANELALAKIGADLPNVAPGGVLAGMKIKQATNAVDRDIVNKDQLDATAAAKAEQEALQAQGEADRENSKQDLANTNLKLAQLAASTNYGVSNDLHDYIIDNARDKILSAKTDKERNDLYLEAKTKLELAQAKYQEAGAQYRLGNGRQPAGKATDPNVEIGRILGALARVDKTPVAGGTLAQYIANKGVLNDNGQPNLIFPDKITKDDEAEKALTLRKNLEQQLQDVMDKQKQGNGQATTLGVPSALAPNAGRLGGFQIGGATVTPAQYALTPPSQSAASAPMGTSPANAPVNPPTLTAAQVTAGKKAGLYKAGFKFLGTDGKPYTVK